MASPYGAEGPWDLSLPAKPRAHGQHTARFNRRRMAGVSSLSQKWEVVLQNGGS